MPVNRYLNHLLFFCSLAGVVLLIVVVTPFFHGPDEPVAEQTQTAPHTPTAGVAAVTPTHVDDPHQHDATDSPEDELPANLQEYIESLRIPADQIPMTHNPDGSITLRTDKQWSTVVMAVIDENGRVRTAERQIQPQGTVEITR
ncbi:MAG: hypothetical protein CMI00_03210 [Oceanospirillaceae bacterium]|nr:hypothetical protein [Oceanospirillaceae bacterium]|tara:strand:- start:1939 stop:2370 length:432 start_codon:yes stop_codon:yes gene_type:complete